MENENQSTPLPEETTQMDVQASNETETVAVNETETIAVNETEAAPLFPMEDVNEISENDAPTPLPEEIIEELEAENFSGYSKQELANRMEELCSSADINLIRNKVAQAREAFNNLVTIEKATAKSKFLEEGNKEEEFEYFPDAVEEAFRKSYSKYTKLKADFILGQEKMREENLKIKKDILAQMKNLIQNEENMAKAFNEFHDLQAKWRNTGAVPPQNVTDLWMHYKLYIDRFYDFIKINRELQILDQKKNLEMKIHICERAEELILEPSLNKAMNEAVVLQNKWKETGFVSREQSNEIWARFRAALDKIYTNKKQFLAELREKHTANYEAKLKMCEQAEAIVNQTYDQHNQFQEGLKTIVNLQTEWRKIGPADKNKNDEVWKKFKSIIDGFFKQKDDFYKKKKQEFAANLQAKTELCIQAEGLQENSDWKATADELIRLQTEWKKYGQVGTQDKNTKIWNRFKAACDVFFNRKKAHFAGQDEEQEQNYNKKIDLIARVEKFEINKEDAVGSVESLKAFQREWSEIGMVPLKKKDGIWDKFRKAVQTHFDGLNVRPDFKQGGTPSYNRNSNAGAPRDNVPSGERDIVNKMNKLKEEVMQLENNIEFFAKTKKPNLIKMEYEKKIQDSKDEIAKLKAKLKEIKTAE